MVGRPEFTVLVIDDNDYFSALVEAFLEMSEQVDWRVISARTLAAGLEEMSAQRVELVLCDLRLPDVDETGLLDHVSSMATQTSIVIATGWLEEAFVTRALAAGAKAVWDKDDVGGPNLEHKLLTLIKGNGADGRT